MFNRLRNKAHTFVMTRLNPVQEELASINRRIEQNHLQTIQFMHALAKNTVASADGQPSDDAGFAVNDVVIVPNYASLLKPSDVFLLSYPRSGNTWMRTIIGGILYPHDLFQSLRDLDDYIPDLNTRFPDHNRYSSPRVVKSHQPYHQREGLGNTQLYKRFIYIVRHPYKVITSFYDFERFRAPHLFTDLGAFVEQVVMGGYHFGNWEQHIISWMYGAKKAEQVWFLRYEDLQKQTIPMIMQLAQFLDHPIDVQQAEVIRQFSSQENMIEMDKKGSEVPGYEFVRRGEDRQTKTKETLSDAMKEMIYAYNKGQMDAWGYGKDGVVLDDYPNKGK